MYQEYKSKDTLVSQVAALQQRIAELETSEAQLKQAEQRIGHINAVLQAIRSVNQLITGEKDRRGRLLQEACRNLVGTRGYHNAWIALLNNSGELITTAQAGLGKDFLPLVEQFENGKLTPCGDKALEQTKVVVVVDPTSTCRDCPLSTKSAGRGAMTVRLEYGRKIYGLISVSIPRDIIRDEEEQSLFQEVVRDIAFALHNLEMEQARKQVEELERKTHHLAERVKELTCLYGIADLVERPGISLEQIVQGTVNLIPLAAQYPEITCARISVEDQEFITKNFRKTASKQTSALMVQDRQIGTVEVGYLEETPARTEGPFLEEEKRLINAIAERLGRIIERKKTEEELNQYSEHLEEMVQKRTKELKEVQEQLVRQEKLSILGQMAGSVGHELRNPLGVISNAAYYLKMTLSEADETTREYLEMISSEVARSEKIISDLLNLSRTRAAQKEKVNVPELISQALEKQPIPQGIEVRREISPHLPYLYLDPRQIDQVLINLIINAYQAMPKGGTLTIKAKEKEDKVLILITDTGVGISKENLSKLFEPLYTTKARGIGLGLCVSQSLTEVNGGEIKVESKEGEGTTFTLTFPPKKVN